MSYLHPLLQLLEVGVTVHLQWGESPITGCVTSLPTMSALDQVVGLLIQIVPQVAQQHAGLGKKFDLYVYLSTVSSCLKSLETQQFACSIID